MSDSPKQFLCLTCEIIEQEKQEMVMAFLSNLGFSTFQESDSYLKAFQDDTEHLQDNLLDPIQEIADQFNFKFHFSSIEDENWNKKWKDNFQPIQIGDFCNVRASFHPKNENSQYDIVINPKMSFGTGHHATTQLMIKLMQPHLWDNCEVLDLGCGTGILSILASKLGANHVKGIDTIDWAYKNAIENVEQNRCDNIQIIHGDVEDLEMHTYGMVLANINKGMIQSNMERFVKFLAPKGVIFLSGVLTEDVDDMITLANDFGLTLLMKKSRDIWSAFSMIK